MSHQRYLLATHGCPADKAVPDLASLGGLPRHSQLPDAYMPHQFVASPLPARLIRPGAAALMTAEFTAIGIHLRHCRVGSRWFALSCAAEALNSFLAPRFLTTLLMACVALIGISALA